MKQSIKSILILLIAILLMNGIASAQEMGVYEIQTDIPHTVEGKTYPMVMKTQENEPVTDSEMTLYFADGGDIPYAEVTEYMTFLSGLLKELDMGEITYNVEGKDPGLFFVSREDNGSMMLADTDNNELSFFDFNLFNAPVGMKAAVSLLDLPETEEDDFDLAEALEELKKDGVSLDDLAAEADTDKDAADDEPKEMPDNIFQTLYSGNFNRSGEMVDIDLSDYDIEIITADGKCYIPFQTLNDLLATSTYTQIVYNGEKVIVSYYQSDLFDMMYEAEPRKMSEGFAHFNYNELRLFLDTFYGLKPEHNIKDFGTFLAFNTGLVTDLTSTDPKVFDNGLTKLFNVYFDDGHSAFLKPSWYSGPDSEAAALARNLTYGPSTGTTMYTMMKFSSARETFYPDTVPGYEEVGDTAFITFDTFTSKRDNYYADDVDLENPADTIELIMYANQQIKREGSPVKNIVLDLSNNGGGSAQAAVAVIGWYLFDAGIAVRDTLTGAESTMFYDVDINRNGEFMDDGDSVSGDYNLYCLISGQSFSAGNLTPAAFRNSRRVVLIGQQSSGGSCVVQPGTTASGALFAMSGPRQLSIVQNGSFYNIDEGIIPNVILTRAESFYDRPALVEFINNLK